MAAELLAQDCFLRIYYNYNPSNIKAFYSLQKEFSFVYFQNSFTEIWGELFILSKNNLLSKSDLIWLQSQPSCSAL